MGELRASQLADESRRPDEISVCGRSQFEFCFHLRRISDSRRRRRCRRQPVETFHAAGTEQRREVRLKDHIPSWPTQLTEASWKMSRATQNKSLDAAKVGKVSLFSVLLLALVGKLSRSICNPRNPIV